MNNFFVLADALASFPENFSDVFFIVDFSVSVVLLILITLFFCLRVKRVAVFLFYGIIDVLFILSCVFSLDILLIVSMVIFATGTILLGFINSTLLRPYIVPSLKHSKAVKTEEQKESKYKDKEKFVADMTATVKWLSENKVGALITIEKETPLDDWIKSGTVINCPFSPEIVETIFYEGTRLHDGAIIIRGETIVAAAVYYQPSTKLVMGKFGARHRAALGISEVSDAVTVLVSEETGRISITHAGLIDNIKMDEFQNSFLASISY